MKISVEVEIFGAKYLIKTDSDPKYTKKLAQYVDQKMREVAEKSKIVSTQKIAVLVSMNVADDLFQQKNNSSHKLLEKIEKKTKSLSELVSSVGVS